MAYTTINDPSEYFTITTYTGDGNDDRSITNSANAGNFKPDWLWIKQRDQTRHHMLVDSNRGATKHTFTSLTNAESTNANGVQAFETNGFQLGTDTDVNQNTGTYVAWQWKSNGGTATATISESGSNPAASVQANTTAGFSIITYTGTGASGTIAHGLGVRPKWILIKNRDAAEGWFINAELITGNTNGGFNFSTDGEYTGGSNNMNASSIDANNIHVISSGNVNTDGQKYVAYCFAEIKGNADGAFVYLGFKPAYILVKATDVDEWRIYDHERANAFNVINVRLKAHSNAAESQDDNECDFLSNGVKWRSSSGGVNSDGQKYIYLAFAEHPFVSSKGVPVTAR